MTVFSVNSKLQKFTKSYTCLMLGPYYATTDGDFLLFKPMSIRGSQGKAIALIIYNFSTLYKTQLCSDQIYRISLHSKRFQSTYSFLLSSQLSQRTRVDTLASEANTKSLQHECAQCRERSIFPLPTTNASS